MRLNKEKSTEGEQNWARKKLYCAIQINTFWSSLTLLVRERNYSVGSRLRFENRFIFSRRHFSYRSRTAVICIACFSRVKAFHYQFSVIQIWNSESSERQSIFGCFVRFLFACHWNTTRTREHVVLYNTQIKALKKLPAPCLFAEPVKKWHFSFLIKIKTILVWAARIRHPVILTKRHQNIFKP